MTNDEIPNVEGMTKGLSPSQDLREDQMKLFGLLPVGFRLHFDIRTSSFLRHSSFVIRHSPGAPL